MHTLHTCRPQLIQQGNGRYDQPAHACWLLKSEPLSTIFPSITVIHHIGTRNHVADFQLICIRSHLLCSGTHGSASCKIIVTGLGFRCTTPGNKNRLRSRCIVMNVHQAKKSCRSGMLDGVAVHIHTLPGTCTRLSCPGL